MIRRHIQNYTELHRHVFGVCGEASPNHLNVEVDELISIQPIKPIDGYPIGEESHHPDHHMGKGPL